MGGPLEGSITRNGVRGGSRSIQNFSRGFLMGVAKTEYPLKSALWAGSKFDLRAPYALGRGSLTRKGGGSGSTRFNSHGFPIGNGETD